MTRRLVAALGALACATCADVRWPPPPPEVVVAHLCTQAKTLADPPSEARLAAHLDSADPSTRAAALRCLARVERRRGEVDLAVQHVERAIEIERALARVPEEVDDRLLLVYIHLLDSGSPGARPAPVRAREALAPVRALAATHPVGAARVAYFEALLARETGDVRAALALFDEALAGAARLGLDDLRSDALAASADALLRAGRYADAASRAQEALGALPSGAPPCARAAKLNDLGWVSLRTPRSERAAGSDPSAALDAALTLASAAGCGPAFLSNTITNLALAAAEREEWGWALELVALARLKFKDAAPRVAHAWLQVEAASSLARGELREALARYAELAARAEENFLTAAAIDAALGEARALQGLGRPADAELALEEAEAAVDRAMRSIPLGGGRDTFAAMHEAVATRHVEHLLARALEGAASHASVTLPAGEVVLGGPLADRAAQLASHSVGRALLALQSADRIAALPGPERASWERGLEDYLRGRDELDRLLVRARVAPVDQAAALDVEIAAERGALLALLDRSLAALPGAPPGPRPIRPPDPGELILVLHPLTSGWATFAVTRERTLARWHRDAPAAPPPAGGAEVLAASLLVPWRAAIAGAARVRVVAYGPLARVHLHALKWDGAPLIDHAAVAYGLGLPARSSGQGGDPAGPRRALLFADESFRGASEEAAAVAEQLAAWGLDVDRVSGDRATAPAVRAALIDPRVHLAHFAGHAGADGVDGLGGSMKLAGGTALTVADILALPRVPPQVVLSACDTSSAPARARAAGLGVAQAFVVAGARVVVASTAAVDDAAAARLLGDLYRGADPDRTDLVDALAVAQRARRGSADGGWALFRALVP